MALPSREDFTQLKDEMVSRLDRLIELAEAGALSPTVTVNVHGEITEAEISTVRRRLREAGISFGGDVL